METIQINLYTFDELKEDAKIKAIKMQKENNYEFLYLDFLIDIFKDEAENIGFVNPTFEYSLSNSQGDGLSFSFDYFESEKLYSLIQKVTGKNAAWIIDPIYNSIYSTRGKGNLGYYTYAHEDQIDIRVDLGNYRAWNFYTNVNDVLNEIEAQIITLYLETCRNFEKRAYDEIEYQLSDEFAIETLINGMQFLKDGTIY
jgi:hypothetical protein